MSSCMCVSATACCLPVSPRTGRGGRKTAERTGARRSAGGSGAQSGIDPPPPLAADGTSLGRPPRSGGAEEGERKLAFVCVGSVCPPHSVGLPGCLGAPPPPSADWRILPTSSVLLFSYCSPSRSRSPVRVRDRARRAAPSHSRSRSPRALRRTGPSSPSRSPSPPPARGDVGEAGGRSRGR